METYHNQNFVGLFCVVNLEAKVALSLWKKDDENRLSLLCY